VNQIFGLASVVPLTSKLFYLSGYCLPVVGIISGYDKIMFAKAFKAGKIPLEVFNVDDRMYIQVLR
jgi:hypothetical protein